MLLPINTNVIVVINNTAAGNVGVGDPFHLTVEGFIDSSYDDPADTPEPATMLMSCGGLVVIGLIARKRLRTS